MKKIGHNQECLCGSGKKYKYCCLNEKEYNRNEYEKLHFDIASIFHYRIFAEGLLTSEDTEINFKQVFDEYFIQNNSSDLITILDSSFWEIYLNHIEEKIVNLCSRHSIYEMIFWLGRIKPTNRYGNSFNMSYNYHKLMKIALFQFGTKNDIFGRKENEQGFLAIPSYFEEIDQTKLFECPIPNQAVQVLETLYKLEALSYYYIYLRNCERIYIKGGVVLVDNKMGLNVKATTSSISYLIDLYDRRSESQTLLTNIGTFSMDLVDNNSDFILVMLMYNFENLKIDFLENLNFIDENQTSNYYPAIINVYEYYLLIKELNPILYSKYGFYIEDLLAILFHISNTIVASLYYLNKENTDDEDENYVLAAINLLQRGYLLYSDSDKEKRELISCFKSMYKEKFGETKKPLVKNLLNAYNYLFLSYGNFESLESENLKGYLFNKMRKDKLLIDCTSFIGILKGVNSAFKSIDGELGNKISADFKGKINSEIIDLFGKDSIYVKGEISNSIGEKKEIDASFFCNEFLFIIECKSLSVSDGSVLGEAGAIEFRKKKVREFITEVEKKADFLVKYKNNLNVKIPDVIKYIVPIVATSFPEYIWDDSDELFLAKDLGRIIVSQELKLLTDELVLREIANKPYIRKI